MSRHVRFGPKADITTSLFDLGGGEQRLRDAEAERPANLAVNLFAGL
jgi:hypothetical protein